ncbi:hypothetical protein G7085_13875 [Tessaracoccus sp. HDW20]|uniref:hypothetical protein n=1 Tax=Tessaracoccus coleopterorum TaxID=2714950 RepID=UPI0018D2E2C5|nr:hypothetical protein [Tessaracoccus coleopterorum]NHB85337.1 hypothetical protein [Tessaracoccus coleopterorum]
MAREAGADRPRAFEHAVTHGARYAVEVHSRSSLTMVAELHQKGIDPGTVMTLTARLSEFGIPVEDDRANVRAELTGPAGPDLIKLGTSAAASTRPTTPPTTSASTGSGWWRRE